MRRRPAIAVAALSALTLFAGGACSSTQAAGRASAGQLGSAAPGPAVGAEATKTPAVELRAGFTYLLTQHAYLTATATGAAVSSSGELTSPALTQALTALDGNAVALSRLVGALYPKGQAAFLVAWRQQDGVLVDAALAAGHDPGRRRRDGRALASSGASFGQLLSSLAPPLPPLTVADALTSDLAAQLRVIDAQVAGSPSQFALLRAAAVRQPATAALLAHGMAQDLGLGDSDTAAGAIRAGLTALLVSHVYVVAAQVHQDSGDAARRSAAYAATDEVARSLAQLLGASYPSLSRPFLSCWRRQVQDLVDYAAAGRRRDGPAQAAAQTLLEQDRTRLGALVHAAVRQLPAATLDDELRPQGADLLLALDDADQASPDAAAALAAAAGRMPGAAEVLAGGVAEDRQLP